MPEFPPGAICPAIESTGSCSRECEHTAECSRGSVCCESDCGTVCIPPAKRGSCPDISSQNGICAELCGSDFECPGDEKCCSNGCGHLCMAVMEIPGPCPLTGIRPDLCEDLRRQRGDECRSDADCDEGRKCCDTCGMSCVTPGTHGMELLKF